MDTDSLEVNPMKLSPKLKNKQNKAKIIFALFVILLALGGVFWYSFPQRNVEKGNNTPAKPEYFGSYEQLNSVPNRTDAATNDPGILVAWADQRVIDGNLSCTIYRKDDRRVLAVYVKTSGSNAESKTSTHTDYKSSEVSRDTIDQIANNYCGVE
jgi:hypothetical protein